GASAQYGSDAIAGVFHIVLKSAGHGGSLSATGGEYSEGDGAQLQLAADAALNLAGDGGTVHLAAQARQQDATNRSGRYHGTAPHSGILPGIGEHAFRVGEAEVDQPAVSANAAFNVGGCARIYLTAIASNRDITSFAFYRSRDLSDQCALLPQVYPGGYV